MRKRLLPSELLHDSIKVDKGKAPEYARDVGIAGPSNVVDMQAGTSASHQFGSIPVTPLRHPLGLHSGQTLVPDWQEQEQQNVFTKMLSRISDIMAPILPNAPTSNPNDYTFPVAPGRVPTAPSHSAAGSIDSTTEWSGHHKAPGYVDDKYLPGNRSNMPNSGTSAPIGPTASTQSSVPGSGAELPQSNIPQVVAPQPVYPPKLPSQDYLPNFYPAHPSNVPLPPSNSSTPPVQPSPTYTELMAMSPRPPYPENVEKYLYPPYGEKWYQKPEGPNAWFEKKVNKFWSSMYAAAEREQDYLAGKEIKGGILNPPYSEKGVYKRGLSEATIENLQTKISPTEGAVELVEVNFSLVGSVKVVKILIILTYQLTYHLYYTKSLNITHR